MAFYTLSDQRSTRSTTFGYGSKLDFTKTGIQYNRKIQEILGFTVFAPAPDVYNKSTEFSTERKDKGKSFGLSRELLKENGHIVKGI